MAQESNDSRRNFLLGYGERLTEAVRLPPRGGGEKAHPYTLDEAREVLMPRARLVHRELAALPVDACPDGEAVALITLHPTYLGRSFFPDDLLTALNGTAVGSRSRELTPRKWTRARHGDTAVTAEIFVAAPRGAFRRLVREMPEWSERAKESADLRKLEDIRVWSLEERLRPVPRDVEAPMMEVVLHAPEGRAAEVVLDGFQSYLRRLDVRPDMDRRLYAGGLCFVPVRVPRERLEAVSQFAFLRVARLMPSLRAAEARGGRPRRRVHGSTPLVLPKGPPLDPSIRVAVFDGGCDAPECRPFVSRIRGRGAGTSLPAAVAHGTKVTSALLFGSVPADGSLARPFANVDHYRVVDNSTASDDKEAELYTVLPRIRHVLQDRDYEFVNISLAPDTPVDDDEPHVWTTVLDEILASGSMLASIAAGNLGEGRPQWHGGSRRICPPADCVNGLTVGACDCSGAGWRRAPYSSVGPGRSPGIVKPDVLQFGGSVKEPFRFVAPASSRAGGDVVEDVGTSYASPAALRTALGVRAHLGPVLSPLAIKALLIHGCPEHTYPRAECGWGRVPDDLDELLTVRDHQARVVYQGELRAKQWLRVPIPVPSGNLQGMVTILATFCFASPVDPQDPINYTRAGLEVVFRPHERKRVGPEKQAKSKPFFRARDEYLTERELRDDHHKWETTLRSAVRIRPDNLLNPVFDVHYHAREMGRSPRWAPPVPYALVVTVSAPGMPDFYNRVVRRYRTQLEALVPVHELPVRTRVRG